MNLKKIEDAYNFITEKMKEDMINDQEYLILVANLLFSWGKAGVNANSDIDINEEDAMQVEMLLNQNPNDPYLAAILQGHILIKWSESFGGPDNTESIKDGKKNIE